MKQLDNGVVMAKSNLVKILFYDNHIVIAEKPRGILTQPTELESDSLEKRVKEWAKVAYNKTGDVFLHVVHRLDQPVSGIVLFAKTSKALTRLNAMQKEKKILKHYIAEVEGIIQQDEKKLVHYLRHDEHKAAVFNQPQKDALESVLTFKVLKRKTHSTIIEIDLITGRYHQIRAQLSAIHHPVVGDVKYGAKKMHDEGILLHHAFLEFVHPVTSEKMLIQSNPDFIKSSYKLD